MSGQGSTSQPNLVVDKKKPGDSSAPQFSTSMPAHNNYLGLKKQSAVDYGMGDDIYGGNLNNGIISTNEQAA
jgi:hypothetical protein